MNPRTLTVTRAIPLDDKYVIRLRNRNGGLFPWSASITKGIAILGEAGSSTYSARTKRACIRRAMRTVSRIASSDARTFLVEIAEDR